MRLFIYKRTLLSGILAVIFSIVANAQVRESYIGSLPSDSWIEYAFGGVAVGLLIIIVLLGRFYIKLLQKKSDMFLGSTSGKSKLLTALALAAFLPVNMYGADGGAVISGNLSYGVFFAWCAVILAELLVIVFLIRNISRLIGLDEPEAVTDDASTPSIFEPAMATMSLWWARINAFKSREKERELIIGHEHDGIRELDNDLPPWWVWGFYITIIFSVVYLWRYHVVQTAPLQEEELEIAIAKAEEKMKAYRATSASLIDESSVTIVEEPDFIAKGKTIYDTNCVACHGSYGEGGVGPNLTDGYWIHGGSISDIFSVVKYGVIEKGMTPWKDLLSPTQMAQVSNYVITLVGTNPPNPKEPQGTLYEPKEEEEKENENGQDQVEI